MNLVSSSRLAQLLNEGFTGEFLLNGRAFAGIAGGDAEEASSTFYEAQGEFRLSAPVSGSKGYSLQLIINQQSTSSNFRFELRNGERATHISSEGYGDIISVPLSLHERAFLQIEPGPTVIY
jgi:hypothetical protein